MSLAVRAVSVEKGEDPREFALVATGGAGPVHAVSIARELNIGTVVVPVLPGQFSAKGMLSSEVRHDLTRTLVAAFTPETVEAYATVLKSLEDEAWERLRADVGEPSRTPVLRDHIDLRYRGQEFTITVPLPEEGLTAATYPSVRTLFDTMHDRLYGHQAPEEAVEAIAVRTVISMPLDDDGPPPPPAPAATGTPEPAGRRPVVPHGGGAEPVECPVYLRDALSPGHRVTGPAVVQEATSSVVIHDGDTLTVAPDRSLVITVGSSL
jgi:N-methylhydantoinase A